MSYQRLGGFVSVPNTGSNGTAEPSLTEGLDLTAAANAGARRYRRWLLKVVVVASGNFSFNVVSRIAPVTAGTDWGVFGLGGGDINGGSPLTGGSGTKIFYFGPEDIGLAARFALVFANNTNVTSVTVTAAPILDGDFS